MFSPEEQQMEICLLKSNLEDIENELVVQRSALPALDAENELRYRETMAELRVARSLNMEIERLKQENMRLTAKRMQLKRQSEKLTEALENTREKRSELIHELEEEKQDIEREIRNYEDILCEKAEQFRKTRGFYNEEEMSSEIEKASHLLNELTVIASSRESTAEDLRRQLGALSAIVPEDLLEITGKQELEDKIKTLTSKFEEMNKIFNI